MDRTLTLVFFGGIVLPSRVYFTDMHTRNNQNLLDKTRRLFLEARLGDAIEPGDLVAIKLHWGEWGNLAYIPPPIVRTIVDLIKEKGGKPFLTDANTLYNGRRHNAVDNLANAVDNGFTYATVGAPLIVADGLRGHDYVNVPIPGRHFDAVKISSAIHHADALIVISHVKGHELLGFGGTIKNVGMGSGAPAGKQMMHSDVRPQVDQTGCTGCQTCVRRCPVGAIRLDEHRKAVIDQAVCIGCADCTIFCPVHTIPVNWQSEPEVVQEKVAEYALGVIQPKAAKVGFLNFIMNVSPDCDCAPWNDVPIVGNLGIMASKDPIAIDQAAMDAINAAPGMVGSRLGARVDSRDKFGTVHGVRWQHILDYGEQLGLGTRSHELVPLWTGSSGSSD